MKSRSEWGPADEIAYGFSKTGFVILALVCSFAFGYGAFNAISSQYVSYQHGEDWNKRGSISCSNGVVSMSNIDWGGEWPRPIDLSQFQIYCQPAKGLTIQTYK